MSAAALTSTKFDYVKCILPAKCLRAIHLLTLSENEWGGQLKPKIDSKDGICKLSCDDIELIKGTGLGPHPDAKLYSGKRSSTSVQVAVTPFYKEVFEQHRMCGSTTKHINMFFHTHPLMMSSKEVARPSPPSLGDFFAHAVLSNSRNYRMNRQLNTTCVMAFEGLYVYTITPTKFKEVMDEIDALVEQREQRIKWTEAERKMWKVGEAPRDVVEELKPKIFDELRPGAEQMQKWLLKNPCPKDLFEIAGAEILADTQWGSKDESNKYSFDFPMGKALGTERLQSFLKTNPLLKHLNKCGFNYVFFPAPFDRDLKIIGQHTVHHM